MSKRQSSMSRRSFIAGGALFGATIAGSGLAGCAPAVEKTPEDSSQVQEGAEVAKNAAYPSSEPFKGLEPMQGEPSFVSEPIPADSITKTVDVDVVVCGAGWSGCCATAAAAEGGASVALLQKGEKACCNGAEVAAFGDVVHEHYGEINDPEAYITDLMYTANYRVDENVVRRFVYRSGDAINWIMDILGDKIAFPEVCIASTTTRGGLNWWSSAVKFAEGVAGLSPMLVEYAQSFGKTEVYYNTPACQLVQAEDGSITGVIAKDEQGNYVQFNAAKGVVLATGGYEFNWERLQRCMRPRDLEVRAWVNGCFGNTGDGHEMGLAVGAFEDEYPHAVCNDPAGTLTGGVFGAAMHPFMRVNDFGVRFVNEAIPSNFLANAVNSQIGAHAWVIADSNLPQHIEKIRDLTIPGTTPESEAEGFISDSVTADTLEELAEKMGVPVEAFVNTITRYNEMYEKGQDEDFHVPFEKMANVVKPPFYALDEGQINLATECGLRVDSDSAVLRLETKTPIPGLYAVGTCSGSMFHDTYPHHCSGISLGRGLTYGMIVGRILSGVEDPVNRY